MNNSEEDPMYVHPIPRDEAQGDVKTHYDAAIAEDGYLQNQELLFGLNPAAKSAWRGLVQAITARMDRRRYELVTLAVANELRCRYCVSAHASVLLESDIFDRAQVEAITRDYRTADCLTPAEVAIMAFAQKLTVDANRIRPDDVEALRTHGLSEEEIFDVTLAAGARNFYSKVLNAMGAEPDDAYADTNDLLELVELRG
jgi:uncharacterized peroxidase-related enzyme